MKEQTRTHNAAYNLARSRLPRHNAITRNLLLHAPHCPLYYANS